MKKQASLNILSINIRILILLFGVFYSSYSYSSCPVLSNYASFQLVACYSYSETVAFYVYSFNGYRSPASCTGPLYMTKYCGFLPGEVYSIGDDGSIVESTSDTGTSDTGTSDTVPLCGSLSCPADAGKTCHFSNGDSASLICDSSVTQVTTPGIQTVNVQGGGGIGDSTRPTSSPVSDPSTSGTQVSDNNFSTTITPTTTSTSGGTTTITTSSTGETTSSISMPTDYARDGTLVDAVHVMQSMGRVLEDSRFNELQQMLRFINDSSNSLDVIEEYQSRNMTKYEELVRELGLQRLNDSQFYDLATNGVDLTNSRLLDIYNKIDWQANGLIQNIGLVKTELQTANARDSLYQTYVKDQLQTANTRDATHQTDLLTALSSVNTSLSSIETNTNGDTDFVPVFDSEFPLDDVLINPDNFNNLVTSVRTIQNNESNDYDSIVNTLISDIDSLIPDPTIFIPSLPAFICTGSINESVDIHIPFSSYTKTINIDLFPCARLAPLREALGWIFAFYAARLAFITIFAPK